MAKSDSRQLVSQVSRPLEEQLAAASVRLDTWIEQCTEKLDGTETSGQPSLSRDGDITTMPDYAQSSTRWTYCITDGGLDHLTVGFASSPVSA
jgi:hypothetical protein